MQFFNRLTIAIISLCLILAGALGYGWYKYSSLSDELNEARKVIEEKGGLIVSFERENADLAYNLLSEKNRNNEFALQIESIAGTVGNLDKLSKTDRELLQKYSKIYFLNEHYTPAKLVNIDEQFLFDKDDPQQIHEMVGPRLAKLLMDAHNEGHSLLVISAFRSYAKQSAVKSSYNVIYGAGTANQFSADQGYSEHQIGTTVDFTTTETGSSFSRFKDAESYKWLLENAYKYGFVLSYPEDNSYYQFEPWHWRFVGVSLSKFLHNENLGLYDLNQRDIDKYLINIFD